MGAGFIQTVIGKAGRVHADRIKKAKYSTGAQKFQRTGFRGQARVNVRSQQADHRGRHRASSGGGHGYHRDSEGIYSDRYQ